MQQFHRANHRPVEMNQPVVLRRCGSIRVAKGAQQAWIERRAFLHSQLAAMGSVGLELPRRRQRPRRRPDLLDCDVLQLIDCDVGVISEVWISFEGSIPVEGQVWVRQTTEYDGDALGPFIALHPRESQEGTLVLQIWRT